MNKEEKPEANYCRWHEVLFSANLAVAITMVLRTYVANAPPYRSKLQDLTIRMVVYINGLLDLRPQRYNPIGLELTSLIVVIGAGVIILLGLWASPKTVRFFTLRVVGLISSLVAVPPTILYSVYASEMPNTRATGLFLLYDRTFWFALEFAAVAALLFIYFAGKWPTPSWGTVLLLAVHYGLWGWFTWQLDFHQAWALTMSFVPPCSALAWFLCIKSSQQALPGNRHGNSK